YLTCETGRIGKFLNHLEIYRQILGLPGEVLEFGVYKGSSFARLVAFRDLLESQHSRRVIGFDIFGKFPADVELPADQAFIAQFEGAGGYGISAEELTAHLDRKGTGNYELIKGDIRQTIPDFLAANPALKIALLHIDVDVYEPSWAILEQLWDKVVPGGILMLDDYGTVQGETRAVDDFFADQDISIRKPPYYNIPSYIVK
ncbi:MAG: TylF/MycF/NovP-related O-methyltransferase, partial [Bacteroidota bacterium]